MSQTAQAALQTIEALYKDARIRILALKEKRNRVIAEALKARDAAKAQEVRDRIMGL